MRRSEAKLASKILKAAKTLAFQGARTVGFYAALKHSEWRTARLLILGYHGISQQDEHVWRPSLFMPPSVFANRMRSISRMGCTVLSLDQAINRLQAETLPSLSVVITFDDGYYNFLSCAYPILKRFGYPATVYQTTFYSSTDRPVFDLAASYLLWKGVGKMVDVAPIYHRPGSLDLRTKEGIQSALVEIFEFARSNNLSSEEKQDLLETLADSLKLNFQDISNRRLFHLMTKEELSRLVREGVDVQLHTHRHRVPESKELFMKELSDNQKFLEAVGQPKPVHFTYPSGLYREQCFPWLAEFGIRSATTCDTGLASSHSNVLCLPRFIDTWSVSSLEFEAWLCGLREFMPSRSRQPKEMSSDSANNKASIS